ncbi:hypothetical protein ACIPSA_50600 [Streptomyces sp. NPDC086549]|uniref:hypothetical protein n=1 Tax=Streptomyces sp. NPDC086549 TaxID=3365752 RepID=UPI0038238331
MLVSFELRHLEDQPVAVHLCGHHPDAGANPRIRSNPYTHFLGRNRIVAALTTADEWAKAEATPSGDGDDPQEPGCHARYAPRRATGAGRSTGKALTMSNPGSRRTQAMVHGRQADTERRRSRVEQAPRDLQKAGEEVSVTAVARRAKVDRTFLYRHRDLLSEVHIAERAPAADAVGGAGVSWASLMVDLAAANERNARLAGRITLLEGRLSQLMGERSSVRLDSVPPRVRRNCSSGSSSSNRTVPMRS